MAVGKLERYTAETIFQKKKNEFIMNELVAHSSPFLQRGQKLFSLVLICLLTRADVGVISNGNRTEWSPIRSVIIRVINKIGRPRSGSPIC